MSEIRATTISDTAGTGPVTLTGQSAAKAWVNFNGTGTVAIRDSFNTASITDNGTGNYSQNFSSAMQNNDFSATGGVSESGVGGQARLALGDGYSTTVCLILSYSPTANIDYNFIAVTTNGDLA